MKKLMYDKKEYGIIGEPTGYLNYKVGDVVYWEAKTNHKGKSVIVKAGDRYALMGWVGNRLNEGYEIIEKVLDHSLLTEQVLKEYHSFMSMKGELEMKKLDLKTGMVIEYRNGNKRVVMLGTKFGDILKDLTSYSYGNMSELSDNLQLGKNDKNWDIMKIYEPRIESYLLSFESSKLQLVWEREKETEAQKQIKALENKIAEAQQEIEKLKKTI